MLFITHNKSLEEHCCPLLPKKLTFLSHKLELFTSFIPHTNCKHYAYKFSYIRSQKWEIINTHITSWVAFSKTVIFIFLDVT